MGRHSYANSLCRNNLPILPHYAPFSSHHLHNPQTPRPPMARPLPARPRLGAALDLHGLLLQSLCRLLPLQQLIFHHPPHHRRSADLLYYPHHLPLPRAGHQRRVQVEGRDAAARREGGRRRRVQHAFGEDAAVGGEALCQGGLATVGGEGRDGRLGCHLGSVESCAVGTGCSCRDGELCGFEGQYVRGLNDDGSWGCLLCCRLVCV